MSLYYYGGFLMSSLITTYFACIEENLYFTGFSNERDIYDFVVHCKKYSLIQKYIGDNKTNCNLFIICRKLII